MKLHLRSKRGLGALAAVAALFAFAAPIASADFDDVPPSNPFYNEINIFKQTNITSGCTATLFCPTDPVRRQAMAAFIDRALGLVTRPGETAPAPVSGSKVDQGYRMLDAFGNSVAGAGSNLQFKVNGRNVLRLKTGVVSPNFIGGSPLNSTTENVSGAVIGGGGGDTSLPNNVTDDYGVVMGGFGNRAGNASGTVGDASSATVTGGINNVASAYVATVAGGQNNQATGPGATVAGGSGNVASGENSFAGGTNAKATMPGSFVWGDLSADPITSPAANTFAVRARGHFWFGTNSKPWDGAGIFQQINFIGTSTGAGLYTDGSWHNNSDRNRKTDFRPLDKRAVLAHVMRMPVTSWRYKAERGARHIGPMAQDFQKAFPLGQDDRHIATVDADGVAMAAIQALYRESVQNQREIARLKVELRQILNQR